MSDPRPRPAVWFAGIAVGVVLVLSQVLLTAGSALWDALYVLGALGATALITLAAWRMRGPLRRVWLCFAGFAALWLVGDLLYLAIDRLQGEVPVPGWPDVPYLASYALAVAGLVVLGRRMNPGRDLSVWIDTAILTVAATAVLGVAVLVPLMSDLPAFDGTAVFTLIYPLADLAILAALLRILLGAERLSVSGVLVAAAFAAVLAADVAYNVDVVYGSGGSGAGLYEALYLLGYVFLAAAATHASAATLGGGARSADATPPWLRTALLAAGVLTTPLVTLIVVWPDQRPVERMLAVLTLAAILLTVARIWLLLRTVEKQAQLLGRQARTDPLTGLPNRRTLDYEIDRAVDHARSAGTPLTVAMLDLDHFKAFNDKAGHQAGDRLLRSVAQRWSALLADGAFLARYGGEEFAILLPGRPADDALPLLESLRAAVPNGQTASIGYAQVADGESGFAALHRADEALFAAKAAGRDRVMAAADPGGSR